MTPHSAQNDDSAWLATLTILYVEDDETSRGLLALYLRRRAGRVVEATDGADGLAKFLTERPAIVVTDIQMPNMDGLAMADEIRRTDPAVAIVVTTAFEQIGYLERSIDAGVDKYVTKPVDTDKLEAALLVCARRHRAEALLARERRRELEAARADGRANLPRSELAGRQGGWQSFPRR
jgi:CheY-like chemotaxis protein